MALTATGNKKPSLVSELTKTGRKKGNPTRSYAGAVSRKEQQRLWDAKVHSDEQLRRVQEVKDMPWPKKAAISMGREGDKLITGAQDLGNFINDAQENLPLIGDAFKWKNRLFDYDPMEWKAKTMADQSSKDEIMQQFDENSGVPGLLGAMAPYVVSGTVAGPVSQAVAKTLINTVGKTVQKVGKGYRGLLQRGVENLAERPGPGGRLGRRMKDEWSDPIIERAKIRSKRPPTRNPETEGMGARVVGGTGLGVVEGGLHHDLSMAEGATAGGFGSATGEVGRRVLGKSAKYWREKDQAIVDWGEAQGMKYLPGMETGRRGAQKFESELKKSSFGDALYQHDLANMQVKNRIAFEAAGMDPKLADNVTPESITKHIEDLKSGYESIEARSIGRIERSNRKAMQDIINGEKAAGTKSSKRTAKMLEAYKSNIEGMSTIKRDKRGRFKKATFDGKAYKDIRSRLKADMKSAANNNRWGEHSALKAFTAQLDEALERGVKDFGGEATVQEWKDLNEKYAVSQLLFKKGTTVNADFDPARLRENLMQHDPIRTITGQGGRIKDLQKLVKLDALERGQAASGFESVDMEPLIHGADKRGPIQSLINTPLAQYVPTLPKMYIGLYKHGYPTTTGALWMNRKGAYEPSRYIRAAAQGSQLHKDAKDGTAKAFNTGKTFAEKWWNGEKDEEK